MDPTANRRETSAATLRRIQQNDPTLTRLEVSSTGFLKLGFSKFYTHEGTGYYWPDGPDDLALLGDAIGKNAHLRGLKIPTARNLADMAANNKAFFEGIHRNKSIRHLHLSYFDLLGGNKLVVEWTSGDPRYFYRNLDQSAEVGRGIMEGFVQGNVNLTEIVLEKCPTLEDGQARVLAAAVRGCASVTDIRLTACNVDDDVLVEIVSGIKALPKLRRLDLSGNHFWRTGCRALATLLEDPACNLEHLSLCNNDRLDDRCAEALADALRRNRRLASLQLSGNDAMGPRAWGAFYRALCDGSSVDATYRSNHTLGNLGNIDAPVALAGLLAMNRGGDEKRVATRKILRCHERLDMEEFHREWDLKVLPIAAAWFDRAADYSQGGAGASVVVTRKLSAIYQFAKALPTMMVPSPQKQARKRKIGETN